MPAVVLLLTIDHRIMHIAAKQLTHTHTHTHTHTQTHTKQQQQQQRHTPL